MTTVGDTRIVVDDGFIGEALCVGEGLKGFLYFVEPMDVYYDGNALEVRVIASDHVFNTDEQGRGEAVKLFNREENLQ